MTATQREETISPAPADQDRPVHLIGLPAPLPPRPSTRRLSFASKIILEKVLLGITIFGASHLIEYLGVKSLAFACLLELGVMIAISVIFGIALLAYIANFRRISLLSRSAIEISQGNLSKPIPFEISKGRFGNDEIDDLAMAITQMQNNLRELIKHVQLTVQSVSRNADELQQSAEEVNNATDGLSATMRQLNQGAADQSQVVNHASTVVHDMALSMQRAAVSATKAASAVENTSETAKISGSTATLAGEKIKKTFVHIEEASQSVFLLDEKIQKITEIVDTIAYLTQQANLLALNATIEAARSGESGRGFAIVAEEIHKLADNCGRSTEQITRLSREITSQAQSVSVLMKEGIDDLGGGREDINTIVGALCTIAATAEEAEGRITSISELTKKQSDGSTQMVHAIEDISNITQINLDSTATLHTIIGEQNQAVARLNGAVQEMTNLTIELQVLLKRFRL